MAVAWLLTLLGCVGAGVGVWLGESLALSRYLAAAGGGLLLGISLFWLLPETAELSGWATASLMAAGAAGVIAAIDYALMHAGHSPRQGVVGPLLIATAIHSFVDGWSVRALSWQPTAGIAVPLGLGLHKIPEGLAVGWLARRGLGSWSLAALSAAFVELFTLVGAYVQPHANERGVSAFGAWWTAGMLAFISGSFLFFGIHAVLPNWKRGSVAAVFFVTLLAIGTIRALGLPFA